ncbi:MAG: anti-sigma factor [Cytophagaceae bacterium]|nr:anti-sigma factor [Cytophagaceae bacterium]
MNVKEYIASGILESYALGLASTEESAEVERVAQQNPEVQNEITTLRSALEEYALTFEQEAPAYLREQVLGSLAELKVGDSQFTVHTSDPFKVEESETVFRNPQRVVPLNSQRSPWMMAASWSFLALSLLGNFLLYSRWRSSEQRLMAAETQNTTLAQRTEVQSVSYDEQLAALLDPATRRIELKGTPKSPNTRALVYWNAPQRAVYLASAQLPAPPAGKQYQLWAIVGGKPVDAGVFDIKPGLLRLKDMVAAEAFAISLEDQGGSTTQAGPKGPVVSVGDV